MDTNIMMQQPDKERDQKTMHKFIVEGYQKLTTAFIFSSSDPEQKKMLNEICLKLEEYMETHKYV